MVTREDIQALLDGFVAARKEIVGHDKPAVWAQGFGRHEVETKYPLLVGGELGGHLMIVGFPTQRDLKFRLSLLFPAPVCRLDYTDETHGNSIDGYLIWWSA